MRWGIRTSLVLGLAGLLAVAGGVAALVVVRLVGGEAEAQVLAEQRARAVAEAAAVAGCGGVGCLAVLVDDGVTRRLAGPGGRWLEGGDGPPTALVLDVVEGGAPGWVVEGRGHRVVAPVALDGGRGALVVEFDLSGLRSAVASRQRTALAYLAFDLLAVLLFGIYVSGRALVRPVVALTRAAEQVGAQEVRLPAPSGPAELWRLHEAFAAMLARLEAARVELVRQEKLATVGRLAAGVAHEVGNPLAAVMGYVEYLRDPRGCSDEQRDALLLRVDDELTRMRDTLRRLLDFSRPTPPSPGEMRLGDAARAAVELVRYQRAMAAVEVVVEGEAPPVWADAGRMRQVFVNLLLNAADAMGEGRVVITLSGVEGEARAVVRDAGPGVAPALVEGLFEPFVTARPSGEGTGLGLAISRRLVEEAGGRLWLEAEAKPGATFVLALPVSRGSAG